MILAYLRMPGLIEILVVAAVALVGGVIFWLAKRAARGSQENAVSQQSEGFHQ
jgi:hypothetical protein